MIAREIQVLSADERERIHNSALTVLEEGEVIVEEEELRNQLLSRGARTGSRSDSVRIPSELVEECLESIDRRQVTRCVNGKTFSSGPQDRFYASLVTDPYIIDFREGPRRPRLDDIARHARLGDALPLVDCIYLMDNTIPDLPAPVSELKCLEVFVSNTTTSYFCAPGSLSATRHWIEISHIMADGSMKENPILNAYVPSVSPLEITTFNTEQLRLFIRNGVLCNLGPCSIAGGTAPYTVAGLIVQSWAEIQALIVAAQVIEPGCPLRGWAGGAHYMDMSGGESMYSGISKALASAAISELCGWLDIPVYSGNFSTLCSNYGIQNGMESTLGVFATFFSRCNGYGALGSMANACGMSSVQIVLHHDLVEMLERFRSGIDITSEKLAVENIVAAGPKGNFLTDALTLKYLRSNEHFYASCFEQCAGTRDIKTMAERAYERAENLMSHHEPDVPENRLEDVRRYVEKELKKIEMP